MNMFGALIGRFVEPKGKRLLRKAFWIVERARGREDIERAVPLLEEAAALAPNSPDVWNELAFVLGRLGRLGEALAAASKAAELCPEHPKFHNAVVGISLDMARLSKTREEAAPRLDRALADMRALAARFPAYPPVRLGIAEVLASLGRPEQDWNAEIDTACTLYEKEDRMGANVETTAKRLSTVLQNARSKCHASAEWWKRLPGAK